MVISSSSGSKVVSVCLKNTKGEVIFSLPEVTAPESWSQQAIEVVASKYFRKGETSVYAMVGRVAGAICSYGLANYPELFEQLPYPKEGWESSSKDKAASDWTNFQSDLSDLLLGQKMAFNSPVWFNVGTTTSLVGNQKPQSSACFILSVEDSMESIMELAATEARLFKGGSGAGSNLSNLRAENSPLSNGGKASGPVSFMRGFDAFAGVIKSGGKTRRAAKMVILNADHPDIEEFVVCKAREEKKAHVLIDAGYDGSFNASGGAYDSIQFQNANHSVRVTDEFMRASDIEGSRQSRLLNQIAESAWICGDPGIQFDTTINAWHTCPQSGRINASNPCSEYMFLDDSACNLASLNLLKFLKEEDAETFDAEAFCRAVKITIIAQELLVGMSSYPTEKIAENSRKFRPLGLGFANLGALLMRLGLPYDSEDGREWAAAITSLMSAQAYLTSAELAACPCLGAFEGYAENRDDMLRVIRKHQERDSHNLLGLGSYGLYTQARELAEKTGFRNAQVTVLAPTGTIGFMMDCDTTGIEPDIALVKYKKLVGGGVMRIVNQSVAPALKRLGYRDLTITEILGYLEKEGTVEGAPGLKPDHLPVFDCAFRADKGKRVISPEGHIRMMAACQPFLSGAISKTVNLPNDASVDNIRRIYVQAWKLGLKSVAVYRDGCKRSQPLTTQIKEKEKAEAVSMGEVPHTGEGARAGTRRRLPDERQAITHKFSIAGHEGYITAGLYDDGAPGEVFLQMSKEGSTLSGLADSFAILLSMALQYGVPLQVLVDKFRNVRFEPSGFTPNPDIRIATSIPDYLARWLECKFIKGDKSTGKELEPETKTPKHAIRGGSGFQTDAPPCSDCGELMVRNGACYKCLSCGSTSGCS